jgi:hypothetical protein
MVNVPWAHLTSKTSETSKVASIEYICESKWLLFKESMPQPSADLIIFETQT